MNEEYAGRVRVVPSLLVVGEISVNRCDNRVVDGMFDGILRCYGVVVFLWNLMNG